MKAVSMQVQNSRKQTPPEVFILDVDGVMTTGQFLYSAQGKEMKVFGPDDNDALSMLSDFLEVRFVTGDRKGFEISKARIERDMEFKLDLVSTVNRVDWIKQRYDLRRVIYMGDGIFDHYVMKHVTYSIAPANADQVAKDHADFVTQRGGGDRAAAEAALHVMKHFFEPYDIDAPPKSKTKLSGEWMV